MSGGRRGLFRMSHEDVSLWYADCLELKATLAVGSGESSAPSLNT